MAGSERQAQAAVVDGTRRVERLHRDPRHAPREHQGEEELQVGANHRCQHRPGGDASPAFNHDRDDIRASAPAVCRTYTTSPWRTVFSLTTCGSQNWSR